ncbi:purple acid phosphatase family protein [Salicibibacter kimchii]|nr:metallophosphoesterase family protein [Salicibibacter kimchii]
MKLKSRRFGIISMSLAACLVVPGITVAVADQQATEYPDEEIHAPTPMPDRIFLGWEDDTATTQSVSWRTDDSVTSPKAQIAEAEAGPNFPSNASTIKAEISEEVEVNHDYTNQIHSVNFEDLEPNTTYLYRVGDGVNWSEWLEFTTASDEDDSFSFLYMGDAQNDIHEHWSRVIRSAYSDLSDASFILHAGDMIDQGDADEQWAGWFEGAGWIYGMVPSIATIGNHEYSRITDTPSQLAENWETQFHYPDNGPEGLEEQVGYWDHQDMRIISLNSNTGHADIDQQAEWLDDVLEDNPNQWTVVTFHHPIFSSGDGRDNEELRDALLPVIEEHSVDLVLQGHDHTYARGHLSNEEDGEREYTTGTMFANSVAGPKMYNWSDANWEENGAYVRSGAEDTQMYQNIHVDGDELKYESYTALGELHDEFTMTKLPDGQKQVTEGEGFEEPEEPDEPSIEQMQTQVEDLLEEGAIADDEAARHFQTHLTSVGHYEETGSTDQAIEHMNGFKELLEGISGEELISEETYESLNAAADELIEQWG